MEKTIYIDGKEVALKSTGATPLRYKAQFGKDFFAELAKLEKLNKKGKKDVETVDFELFYNLTWLFAKTANKDIPSPLEWLDGFDSFPIQDIMGDVMELVTSCISTKKK